MLRTFLTAALVATFALLTALSAPIAVADDEPDPRADPVLTPEQQEEHDAEVAKHLDVLLNEKNKEMVERQISALGTNGSRAARDALIEYSKAQKNHEYVSHAYAALARIGGTTVIEHLLSEHGLGANDFMKQRYAAEALGNTKDARGIEPVLELLNDKKTKIEVEGACCIALAKMGAEDERCIDAVMRNSAHKHDTVRANAAEALGYLGSTDALQRLVYLMEKDKNTRVRGAAATGLGILKNPEAIPALQKAAEGDKSLTVKDRAIWALEQMGATLR